MRQQNRQQLVALMERLMEHRNRIIYQNSALFFGQVLSSSTQPNQSSQATSNNELADLQQVLNADSLEEVLDLLGVSHDDGLLILQLGEEGKAVSMDEMLELNNILNALGIDDEQLQKNSSAAIRRRKRS
ncbi:hypothetical protein OL548_12575 [Lysinibacillus sp. MHQ-1]|nr:hypothetical protein OL548_12575 [Lysinibacillus sp. MHQ-1]